MNWLLFRSIPIVFSSQTINLDLRDVPADFVPRWNILYAIIHTIYTPAEGGEGDEQYTVMLWRMYWCSYFLKTERVFVFFVAGGSQESLVRAIFSSQIFLLKRIQNEVTFYLCRKLHTECATCTSLVPKTSDSVERWEDATWPEQRETICRLWSIPFHGYGPIWLYFSGSWCSVHIPICSNTSRIDGLLLTRYKNEAHYMWVAITNVHFAPLHVQLSTEMAI